MVGLAGSTHPTKTQGNHVQLLSSGRLKARDFRSQKRLSPKPRPRRNELSHSNVGALVVPSGGARPWLATTSSDPIATRSSSCRRPSRIGAAAAAADHARKLAERA